MSRHNWKAPLKITNCRGNIRKIAREMRTLTYEELHDEDVAFEIAFERACDIVKHPGDLHTYYMNIYMDYITKTVRFEDLMMKKFCYSGGYSIGLSDEVTGAVVRLMTRMADSTETEWLDRYWTRRLIDDTVRACHMDAFSEELTKYFRDVYKLLVKSIQGMRRLDNARTKTEYSN